MLCHPSGCTHWWECYVHVWQNLVCVLARCSVIKGTHPWLHHFLRLSIRQPVKLTTSHIQYTKPRRAFHFSCSLEDNVAAYTGTPVEVYFEIIAPRGKVRRTTCTDVNLTNHPHSALAESSAGSTAGVHSRVDPTSLRRGCCVGRP